MSKAARVRALPIPAARSELSCMRGRLFDLTADGRVRVTWGRGGPCEALIATSCSDRALLQAIRRQNEVLLEFVDGRPVVMGLLRERLIIEADESRTATEQHLVVEGKESVTIACGQSAIELHASGRVTVRGTEITSVSSGTHLVEGSPVRIN